MREVCLGVLVLCVATTQASRRTEETTPPALTAARLALGGDTALGAVHALRMTGRSARVLGPVQLTGDVVIDVVLPDRYLRMDSIAIGGRSSETVTGFTRGALIQRATAGGIRIDPASMVPPELKSRGLPFALAAARQEASLLLLGFFCAGFDRSLQFSGGGIAESPDGTAEIIDVRAEGLAARLFLDTRTHLPLMVSWNGPAAAMAGLRLGGAPPGERPPNLDDLLALGRTAVEHRFYFADYRPVGAVKWPFRVRRSVGGDTTEELTFERLLVNPTIDPRAFDAEP